MHSSRQELRNSIQVQVEKPSETRSLKTCRPRFETPKLLLGVLSIGTVTIPVIKDPGILHFSQHIVSFEFTNRVYKSQYQEST